MSIQQSTIEQPLVLRKKFCLMLHWFRSIPEVEIFNFNQNSLIRCFQSPDNFDTGTTDDLSASSTRRVVCWHGWKNTAIFLQHSIFQTANRLEIFQSKRSRIHNGSPWFSFMSGQRIRSRIHIFKLNFSIPPTSSGGQVSHGKPSVQGENPPKSMGPTSWYCEYSFHEQKSACSTSWARILPGKNSLLFCLMFDHESSVLKILNHKHALQSPSPKKLMAEHSR